MADSTTDHEAVLTVAQSLNLGHISQLAVSGGSGAGGGDVELRGDCGDITAELTSRQ